MAGAVGPGWSWMRIYSPWQDDSPLGYGVDVFDTQQAAIDNLQSYLSADLDGQHAKVAAAMRTCGRRGPLVLYYNNNHGLMWAWPVYQVASGEDSRRAGSVFFAEWRSSVLADQGRFLKLINARGASILPQNEWWRR